jgi:ribosomal protein L18E
MLLFKLQRENAQLKRALAEKGVAASPAPSLPTPVAPAAGGVPVAGGSLAGGIVPQARDAVPPVAAGPTVPTRGAPPAKSVPALGLPGGALARLRELVQQDAENTPARPDDPLDAFLIVEAFRFLRRVERVVTRMAGGLIQLYQLRTTVPGVEGNLRELLVAILENINAPAARADLLDYLKGLGHWLVVSLGAYRGAAEKFALQLKADLTAEALIANDPISVVKKVSGKSDAELWRRVTTYLRNLSPDRVNERVEQFARETADDLARKEEA